MDGVSMAGKKNGVSSKGTILTFLKGRACSDTLLHVLTKDYDFDPPMTKEEKASMLMAGGIIQHGYQCGLIWGAALGAGALAYRLHGAGPLAETAVVVASQRLVESFRALNNNINCLEITDIDKSSTAMKMITYFLIKGGSIGCFRMAGRYAPAAFDEIRTALSEKHVPPSSPASCSAVLAEKIGASGLHTVMAAGLAGGIGLCGGACGALGAAVWFIGMKSLGEGTGRIDFKNAKALAAIDKFVKCSDYEFECSKITGRSFKDVNDHACYLRGGGCSKIIDVLAGECSIP